MEASTLIRSEINAYETSFLYNEIFIEKVYLKNGISIRPGDTVVDIGANIGLFSLFILSNYRDLKVFSIEPAPAPYDCLKTNLENYSERAKVYNIGIADKDLENDFIYYPGYSTISGMFANQQLDAEVIKDGTRTFLKTDVLDKQVEDVVDRRLQAQYKLKVLFKKLSTFIRDEQIEVIDLLKVDVEKSELNVLAGIEIKDFKKIRQIVLEVHGNAQSESVSKLLVELGYRVVVELDKGLSESDIYCLYAKRIES